MKPGKQKEVFMTLLSRKGRLLVMHDGF